jgi:hypothetical protein
VSQPTARNQQAVDCSQSKKALAASTSGAVQQPQVLAAALWPVLR